MKLPWWVTMRIVPRLLLMVDASLILHSQHPPASAQEAFTPSIPPPRPAHSRLAHRSLLPSGLSLHHDPEGASLSAALSTLVTRDLAECSLVVAADHDYLASTTLQALARLPNQKQVVSMAGSWEAVGKRVVWQAPGCRAYIFLLHYPKVLLSLANAAPTLWDYAGKFIVTGLTWKDLETLTLSHKGKKTEHLVGLVQLGRAGEWHVYVNQLYWGHGMSLYATWRYGRFSTPSSPFFDKISDIRGAVLKVVTFEWEPSTLYIRTKTSDVLALYGRDVEVVKALSPVFNFTIKFIEPPNDERWGQRLPNGSWDGVVGMLGRGDADLAIANLFVSALQGRDQYQGYTTFFDTDDSCFIIRTEPPLPRWQAPALPFTLSSWLAILGSLLGIGFILSVVASVASKNHNGDIGPKDLGSFFSALLFTLSLHLQHPHPVLPPHPASRILVAFLLLYTLILSKAYSCNLTAFLTIARQPTGIETIQELYESPLSLYETTYFIRNSLAESPNVFLRGLVERHKLVKDMKQVMMEVSKGKGVFVQNRSAKEFITNTQSQPSQGASTTRVLKECFATYTVAVGIPSYSPLKSHFDVAISRIFESGLVWYWKQESHVKFKKNKKENNVMQASETGVATAHVTTRLVPLSLDHLQSAFYVLAFSLVFSTVVLISESSQKH